LYPLSLVDDFEGHFPLDREAKAAEENAEGIDVNVPRGSPRPNPNGPEKRTDDFMRQLMMYRSDSLMVFSA
jgi:hypothetical protein